MKPFAAQRKSWPERIDRVGASFVIAALLLVAAAVAPTFGSIHHAWRWSEVLLATGCVTAWRAWQTRAKARAVIVLCEQATAGARDSAAPTP
jgi:hypothetical protein